MVYYEASHEPAVRAFNSRMRGADALLFALPETARAPNPNTPAPGTEFRHFVVVDDAGEVRGGYFIRTQPFIIREVGEMLKGVHGNDNIRKLACLSKSTRYSNPELRERSFLRIRY